MHNADSSFHKTKALRLVQRLSRLSQPKQKNLVEEARKFARELNAFAWSVVIVLALMVGLVFYASVKLFWPPPPLIQGIGDLRLGTDYQEQPITDGVLIPGSRRIVTTHDGSGVHEYLTESGRLGLWHQHTKASTKGQLPSNSVSKVEFDGETVFYVTSGGGVASSSMDLKTWKKHFGISGFEKIDVSEITTAFLTSDQRLLFLATKRHGIGIYDTAEREWQKLNGENESLSSDTVNDMQFDIAHNLLWVGTAAGVNAFVFDLQKPLLELVRKPAFEHNGEGDITKIYVDTNNVWLCTRRGGLRVLRNRRGGWETLVGEEGFATTYGGNPLPISAIEEFKGINRHELWVGTNRRGVYMYDVATHNWQQAGLETISVNALEAFSGTIWAATEKGIYRLDAGKWVQESNAPTTPTRILNIDGDDLWYITQSGGVGVRRGQTTQWHTVISDASLGNVNAAQAAVEALAVEGDQKLWVASTFGIAVYDTQDHGWKLYNDGLPIVEQTYRISDLKLSSNTAWCIAEKPVGDATRLVAYQLDEEIWYPITFDDVDVLKIEILNQFALCLLSNGHLHLYDHQFDEHHKKEALQTFFNSSPVHSVAFRSADVGENRLYIGIDGNQILYYDTQTRLWNPLKLHPSLRSSVRQVRVGDDKVWHVTEGGGSGYFNANLTPHLLLDESGISKTDIDDEETLLSAEKHHNRLFFATHSGQIYSYHLDWRDIEHHAIDGNTRISSVNLRSNQDYLWCYRVENGAGVVYALLEPMEFTLKYAIPEGMESGKPITLIFDGIDNARKAADITITPRQDAQSTYAEASINVNIVKKASVVAPSSHSFSDLDKNVQITAPQRAIPGQSIVIQVKSTPTMSWKRLSQDHDVKQMLVSDSTMVYLTRQGGIHVFEGYQWLGRYFDGVLEDRQHIELVTKDNHNRLWVATKNGKLSIFDIRQRNWDTVLETGFIGDIAVAQLSGQLDAIYVGSSSGLYRFQSSSLGVDLQPRQEFLGNVKEVQFYAGRLWCLVEQEIRVKDIAAEWKAGFLFHLDTTFQRDLQARLASRELQQAFKKNKHGFSKKSDVWVAEGDPGEWQVIAQKKRKNKKKEKKKHQPRQEKYTIRLEAGRLNVYKTPKEGIGWQEVLRFDSKTFDLNSVIAAGHVQNEVWFVTHSGNLIRYNAPTHQSSISSISPDITSAHISGNGLVWYQTTDGRLSVYHGKNGKKAHFKWRRTYSNMQLLKCAGFLGVLTVLLPFLWWKKIREWLGEYPFFYLAHGLILLIPLLMLMVVVLVLGFWYGLKLSAIENSSVVLGLVASLFILAGFNWLLPDKIRRFSADSTAMIVRNFMFLLGLFVLVIGVGYCLKFTTTNLRYSILILFSPILVLLVHQVVLKLMSPRFETALAPTSPISDAFKTIGDWGMLVIALAIGWWYAKTSPEINEWIYLPIFAVGGFFLLLNYRLETWRDGTSTNVADWCAGGRGKDFAFGIASWGIVVVLIGSCIVITILGVSFCQGNFSESDTQRLTLTLISSGIVLLLYAFAEGLPNRLSGSDTGFWETLMGVVVYLLSGIKKFAVPLWIFAFGIGIWHVNDLYSIDQKKKRFPESDLEVCHIQSFRVEGNQIHLKRKNGLVRLKTKLESNGIEFTPVSHRVQGRLPTYDPTVLLNDERWRVEKRDGTVTVQMKDRRETFRPLTFDFGRFNWDVPNSMVVNRQGLWIATEGGIVEYRDPISKARAGFPRLYTQQDGLGDPNIIEITSDEQEKIYCRSRNGAITTYGRKNNRSWQAVGEQSPFSEAQKVFTDHIAQVVWYTSKVSPESNLHHSGKLKSDFARRIAQNEHALWVDTESGVMRCTLTSRLIIAKPKQSSATERNRIFSSPEVLDLGTLDNTWRVEREYDSITGERASIHLTTNKKINRLPFDKETGTFADLSIRAVLPSATGAWLATKGGIWQTTVENNQVRFQKLYLPQVNVLDLAAKGNEIYGLTEGGVFKYDAEQDAFLRSLEPFPYQHHFVLDASLGISGTESSDNGIRQVEIEGLDESLGETKFAIDMVHDMLAHDGLVWLATQGGIVKNTIENKHLIGQKRYLTAAHQTPVTAIEADFSGRLFAKCNPQQGEVIYQILPESSTSVPKAQSPFTHQPILQQKIPGVAQWYKQEGRIYAKVDQKNVRFHQGKFDFDTVYAMIKPDNQIWFATEGGVYRYAHPPTANGKFGLSFVASVNSGLTNVNSPIRRITKEKDTIFCATHLAQAYVYREAVNVWEPLQSSPSAFSRKVAVFIDGTLQMNEQTEVRNPSYIQVNPHPTVKEEKVFHRSGKFSFDFIKSVAVADKTVWLATAGGVMKYQLDKDFTPQKLYTGADGLPNEEIGQIAIDGEQVLCKIGQYIYHYSPSPQSQWFGSRLIDETEQFRKNKIVYSPQGWKMTRTAPNETVLLELQFDGLDNYQLFDSSGKFAVDDVLSLVKDGSVIWLLTRGWLARCRYVDNQIRAPQELFAIPQNGDPSIYLHEASRIRKDSLGRLWLRFAQEKAIFYIFQDGQWQVPTQDDLPNPFDIRIDNYQLPNGHLISITPQKTGLKLQIAEHPFSRTYPATTDAVTSRQKTLANVIALFATPQANRTWVLTKQALAVINLAMIDRESGQR